MATRQYIGARYVPKFFNFNGSSEWQSGVAYEALTIVTRNGNSYTSKKPVPANIGAPEQNTEYWVATGIYNQQVEQFVQMLTDFMSDGAIGSSNLADNAVTSNKIADGAVTGDKLADRYIINVGDSYQQGYDPNGNNAGWGSYLFSMFGYRGKNITGVGGAGFGAGANNPLDFTTILNNNPPTDIDYDKVTDIVVGGGYNDFNRSANDISAGITRFYNHCKNRYPKAKIWVAPIGWAWTNNGDGITPAKVGATYRTYMSGCRDKDMTILNSCIGVLFGCNGLSTADYKHPTEAGNKAIASAIHAGLNGQEYTASGAVYNLPITTPNWSGSIKATVLTCGGMASIILTPLNVKYQGTSVQLNYFILDFARHPFMCMIGQRIGTAIHYDSSYVNTPVAFEVQVDGRVGLGLQVINEARSNYTSAAMFELFGGATPDTAFTVHCANAQ